MDEEVKAAEGTSRQRRYWTTEEKRRIVELTLSSTLSVASLARQHGTTCASKPGPGRPRSITRSGAGACTTHEHLRQLIFGRTWRITKKLAGMYSSISEVSSPSLRNSPLQQGQLGMFRKMRSDFAAQMCRKRSALTWSACRHVLTDLQLLGLRRRLGLDHAST